MQNQERRNALALCHVSDGGEVAVLRRIIAELLAITVFRLRLTMHPPSCFYRFDDGRHVERIPIDGDAAFDHLQRQALGLQIAIINRDQRGQLRAGGMAHDEQTLRISTILGDMTVHPTNRLGDVAVNCLHVDGWHKAIIGGNENETLVHERLRFQLHFGFVAHLPASAMNPENDRQLLRILRRINVEDLLLVRRIGVGNVAFDVLSLGGGQEGKQ